MHIKALMAVVVSCSV